MPMRARDIHAAAELGRRDASLAVAVLWLIALFAILSTERYPRGIFDFNLAVTRWTWRIGFYSYYALGTDRYPPFTLGPDSNPAWLEVEYSLGGRRCTSSSCEGRRARPARSKPGAGVGRVTPGCRRPC